MRLAGRNGEGGGDGDHNRPRLGQGAVQLGEADVVADGQAEPAPGRVGHDRAVARTHRGALAPALACRQIDVIDMQLVIGRDDGPRMVDQQGAVGGAIVALMPRADDGRADQQPDTQLPGQGAQVSDNLVPILRRQNGVADSAVLDQEIGRLWGQDQLRPARRRVADQGLDMREGRRRRGRGAGLDQGDGERGHQALSNASSSPRRSSACRSSEPPICFPPMKICGKVIRPPDRWIISCFFEGSLEATIFS